MKPQPQILQNSLLQGPSRSRLSAGRQASTALLEGFQEGNSGGRSSSSGSSSSSSTVVVVVVFLALVRGAGRGIVVVAVHGTSRTGKDKYTQHSCCLWAAGVL